MRFLIICLSLLIASPAIASDVTVEMLNRDADGNRMVYSQEIIEIAAGSTVKWVPTDKGHNVEIIASPNDMKFKSKNGKEASVTFETPGIYYYWCTPHKGMGMIGLVVVGGDTSNKAQILKAKAIGKSKKKLKALLEQLN
jgi:pseudoazurin